MSRASGYLLILLAASCGGEADPVTPAEEGELRVAIVSTGLAVDPDGYLLQVDQESPVRVPANGEIVLTLRAGQHTIALSDIAPECVAPASSWVRFIHAAARSDLEIQLECLAPGTLHVVTSTEGVDRDPEFLLVINRGPPIAVGAQTGVDLRVRPGTLLIELRGVAGNCAVSHDGKRRELVVLEQQTATIRFDVHCADRSVLGPGEYLVVSRPASGNADADLFLLSAQGLQLEQLTDHPDHDIAPDWSPDGRRVVFLRTPLSQVDPPRIMMLELDQRSEVGLNLFTSYPVHWSPDGRRIVFNQADELVIANADGSSLRTITRATGEGFWSPDGRWLAFTRGAGAERNIHIVTPDGTESRQITSQGNREAGPWSGRSDALLTVLQESYPCSFRGYPYPCGFSIHDLIVVTIVDGGTNFLPWTPLQEQRPAWSPDGVRVLFLAHDFGRFDVYALILDTEHIINLTQSVESEGWFTVGRVH